MFTPKPPYLLINRVVLTPSPPGFPRPVVKQVTGRTKRLQVAVGVPAIRVNVVNRKAAGAAALNASLTVTPEDSQSRVLPTSPRKIRARRDAAFPAIVLLTTGADPIANKQDALALRPPHAQLLEPLAHRGLSEPDAPSKLLGRHARA